MSRKFYLDKRKEPSTTIVKFFITPEKLNPRGILSDILNFRLV